MKIKTPMYFSGVKRIRKSKASPTEFDFKYSEVKTTDNFFHCYGIFRSRESHVGEEIEVTDVYHFCGLVRFFYKEYCCAIQEKYFEKI